MSLQIVIKHFKVKFQKIRPNYVDIMWTDGHGHILQN